ncbi:hypothetical protein [Prevotella sp.]|uniref:hypothetical protein n=1 Tax=Prevotella sp. TaxID=59823 RepID=UPI00307C2BEC
MRILIGIRKICMVIRHENMVFKDRRTEEQEGLLARGKTEEQKNMGLLAGIRQKNRRTWGLLTRGKTGEQKNMGIACEG